MENQSLDMARIGGHLVKLIQEVKKNHRTTNKNIDAIKTLNRSYTEYEKYSNAMFKTFETRIGQLATQLHTREIGDSLPLNKIIEISNPRVTIRKEVPYFGEMTI